jgi:hypothetical protein
MRDVGYVQKAGHNDFQNYKYATEADAIAALRPAMIKHGLCMIPSVESVEQDEWGNTNVLMHYRILDEEGNFLSFRAAGSGNDKNSKGVGDKGIYKALTGASKYALLKTFMMETGDDPEVPSQQEKESKPEPKPEFHRASSGTTTIVTPQADESDLSDAREAFVMMIKECAETCTTQKSFKSFGSATRVSWTRPRRSTPRFTKILNSFLRPKKRPS